MTTLVLRSAGSVIGGSLLGPVGAAIGGALGATAGFAIDQAIFGREQTIKREGPRLSDLQVQTSSEGAAIQRVYGRARINGQIIWATNYVEKITRREEKTGASKGGGGRRGRKVQRTTYSYYANFAIGLCEGEIAYIGRIWANGRELDQKDITFRVYRGSKDQLPDSLIEAKQGAGNCTAYRGLAYIVFEELPLAQFGNRIPQLSFEVVRPIGRLEKSVQSITMIPGASEFGYDTQQISRKIGEGQWQATNRHSFEKGTDFDVSLDHLTALCPNLKRIALVVAWFGNDLRAGHCSIRPYVDTRSKPTREDSWSVAGETRANAQVVSQAEGRPAYGGTPSDTSVRNAIAAIKKRGLEVVLYPFLMMDVPKGNQLPDPYGSNAQASYPWRGRITCHPAPGQSNSSDKTAQATSQLTHFYSAQSWSYRRFIRHYAQLAADVGGVDAFLIGSELRGLTRIRNETNAFPFVNQLKNLATEVRTIVGPTCKLTYGADWSEYFGYHPANEPGVVFFHLDPLWADPAIDAVGIDNYMPLSDWRMKDNHKDASSANSEIDSDYLASNIAGGEGYDWFYASKTDRQQQVRTPITDGAANKAWVFRYKDLVNWWSNQHFDRPTGSEAQNPTPWQPQSKPIWFTELGCPATQFGTNQPNVFPDPKSSENAKPYFSDGSRDDAVQRALLTTCLNYWQQTGTDKNPLSPIYNGPMVDPAHIYLWTWDARPFPVFPLSLQTWSDGNAWQTGHWLTGRLGAAPLEDLFQTIFADYGYPVPNIDHLAPVLDGFVLDRRISARAAIEGLCNAFGLSVAEEGDKLTINSRIARPIARLTTDSLVDRDKAAMFDRKTASWDEQPASITLAFKETMADYRQAVVRYDQPTAQSKDDASISLAVVSTQPVMQQAAQRWLREKAYARHSASFILPPTQRGLRAGNHVTLAMSEGDQIYRIDEIEDGMAREVTASLAPPRFSTAIQIEARTKTTTIPETIAPIAEVMNLPLLPEKDERPHAPYIAAFAKPWPGSIAAYEGSSAQGFKYRQSLDVPAIFGKLSAILPPRQAYIWDDHTNIELDLLDGALSSVAPAAVLNGANAAAIRASNGEWEILQFAKAELIAPGKWRLSQLLRGQLGTEAAARSGAQAGARFVLLDEAVVPLEVSVSHLQTAIPVRLAPQGVPIADANNLNVTCQIEGHGLRPLSPVHLSVQKNAASNNWTMHWIRRGRVNADSWVGLDIPLGEDTELYQVTLKHPTTDALIRRETTASPQWIYRAIDQQTDNVGSLSEIAIEIAQMSQQLGAGEALKAKLHLPSLTLA